MSRCIDDGRSVLSHCLAWLQEPFRREVGAATQAIDLEKGTEWSAHGAIEFWRSTIDVADDALGLRSSRSGRRPGLGRAQRQVDNPLTRVEDGAGWRRDGVLDVGAVRRGNSIDGVASRQRPSNIGLETRRRRVSQLAFLKSS